MIAYKLANFWKAPSICLSFSNSKFLFNPSSLTCKALSTSKILRNYELTFKFQSLFLMLCYLFLKKVNFSWKGLTELSIDV